MIDIYDKGNSGKLDAQQLKDYCAKRIEKCPRMAEKTFCSACPIHCYRNKEREQIKDVMKYSGPRMVFSHPVLVMKHALISLKKPH